MKEDVLNEKYILCKLCYCLAVLLWLSGVKTTEKTQSHSTMTSSH